MSATLKPFPATRSKSFGIVTFKAEVAMPADVATPAKVAIHPLVRADESIADDASRAFYSALISAIGREPGTSVVDFTAADVAAALGIPEAFAVAIINTGVAEGRLIIERDGFTGARTGYILGERLRPAPATKAATRW